VLKRWQTGEFDFSFVMGAPLGAPHKDTNLLVKMQEFAKNIGKRSRNAPTIVSGIRIVDDASYNAGSIPL